jgi:hypothetical protein
MAANLQFAQVALSQVIDALNTASRHYWSQPIQEMEDAYCNAYYALQIALLTYREAWYATSPEVRIGFISPDYIL